MRTWLSITVTVVVAFACGCASLGAGERRQELVEKFPPGKLSEADVHTRVGEAPLATFNRPEAGWSVSSPGGDKALASERTTHKSVRTVEIYLSPDGMFSLQHVWFCFDDGGVLVDVGWEQASD